MAPLIKLPMETCHLFDLERAISYIKPLAHYLSLSLLTQLPSIVVWGT